MSYPTDREVIRELIDTSHNAFEQGYKTGQLDLISQINHIINENEDAEKVCCEIMYLLDSIKNAEAHHD